MAKEKSLQPKRLTRLKAVLKKKWFWALLISIGLLAYCSREKEVTYLVLNDGQTKAAIPKEIVKSKDCNKYHEWFYSHMTPLTARSDRCPWAKPPKGRIGEFVVNGEKFWIPREYLWPDRRISDGYNDGMNLLMIYPDMTPPTGGNSEEERNNEILVSFSTTYYWENCRVKGLCDVVQHKYEHVTDLKDLNKEDKKIYPKNMGYKPGLDLTEYHFKRRIRDFYVRGDKYKPTYWLMCDGGIRKRNWDPGCYSYFNWNDKLYIEYTFRQTDLLPHHDEVRRKIIEKLKEFQQEPGER